MSKRPTKFEQRHMDAVAALGCMVCGRNAEIHHITTGMGMSQRASNLQVIPLCPEHHRTGGHGVAIHAGKRTWEAKFGYELELLDKLRGMI